MRQLPDVLAAPAAHRADGEPAVNALGAVLLVALLAAGGWQLHVRSNGRLET